MAEGVGSADGEVDGHAEAYAAAADDVRRLDKDRFLSCLFMPEPARRHVLAILAFSAEIARVRDVVSSPMPGEIRLQWWRDLLESPKLGASGAPPLAEALIDTIGRFNLPTGAFMHLIDARVFDLYDDPMPSLNDLEGYCGETVSALFQLSAIVLASGADPGTADLSGHAGVAYGLTGLLRALPFHAARGQVYVPLDLLAENGVDAADILAGRATPQLLAALKHLRATARRHLSETRKLIRALPPSVAPAFLPLALVEPMLDRMEKSGYDPFRTPIDQPQWRKQVRLWWAARQIASAV
jgi:phytoene synthase